MATILDEISTQHQALLELTQQGDHREIAVPQVQEFLQKLAAAGSEVSDGRKRSWLRGLIRFWSSFTYDQTGRFPEVQLLPASAITVSPDTSRIDETTDDQDRRYDAGQLVGPYRFSDLRDLLEKLIEETPGFDDRIRKQLATARALCRIRPSDPNVNEYYELCLDTLTNMRQARTAVGFEWHIMSGAVELCNGMHFATRGDLPDAGKSFKASAASFKDGSCAEGEALAYVGLARSYCERKSLTKARDAYVEALIRLNSLSSMDFTLRQLKKHVERMLDEIENELVEPSPSPDVSAPSGTMNHSKPIPIVGEIKAGYPGSIVEDDIDHWEVVNEWLVRNAEFGVKVKGTSMIGAGILEDDYAFIRSQRSDLRPADIAAVVIVSSDGEREATLKHVEWRDDHWCLRARNDSIKPKVVVSKRADVPRIVTEYNTRGEEVDVAVGTVEIVGKVVAALRHLP